MKGIAVAIFFLVFALYTSAQFKIEKPVEIPYQSQFDSIRIRISKFCLGNVVTQSKLKVDIRIFRYMAFGDTKLIRILASDTDALQIDIYSITAYKDSLIYHKRINDLSSSLKIKKLFEEHNVLNVPDLDNDYRATKELPISFDGNIYYIEAKVNSSFTFKEFDNPEIYAKYFSDKAKQAKVFTDFIIKLEKVTNTKLTEHDNYGYSTFQTPN